MKKLVLSIFLCLASVCFVDAQKNALGLRFGGAAEILYQRSLSTKNFLQFTLGSPNYDGFTVTGIYNWRCCQWDWTPQACDWYLNAGVGAALGFYDFDDSGLLFGVAGSCAFGCLFKRAPISIEIDYRPVVGPVIGGHHEGFYTPGFWNFGFAIACHF